MLNKEQPLWLPKGSIRAIIALSLIWGAIYAGLVLREVAEATSLGVMAIMVVKDYFKVREDGL